MPDRELVPHRQPSSSSHLGAVHSEVSGYISIRSRIVSLRTAGQNFSNGLVGIHRERHVIGVRLHTRAWRVSPHHRVFELPMSRPDADDV